MKIAVLSDIHGNVPALEAVIDDIQAWGPDRVIVNGDLVSRGPCSLACLELLERRLPECTLLKGNHETFVLSCADQAPDPDSPTHELNRFARWSARQLGGAVERIRPWAEEVDFTDLEGGSSFHVTHGSRLGNRDGIHPELEDDALAARLGAPRALFVGSHTHRPLMRRLNGTLVVNTGSVGQPFDGDPRAAYGRFTFRSGRWHADIARVAYDRGQAERDFRESGFLDAGGPLAGLIFQEFREARMLVGRFMARYLAAIKARELTAAEALARYRRSL